MPFPRGVEGARHQAARQGPTLLLRVDFFSHSVRGRIVGRYSSGQRGLTVNQVASPSQVRILACPPLRTHPSGRSSGVELQPSKLAVASSNLVARSISADKLTVNRYSLIGGQGRRIERLTYNVSRLTAKAHVAQLAEHVLGKDEVTRSIRVVGSKQNLFDASANNWRDAIKPQVLYAPGV